MDDKPVYESDKPQNTMTGEVEWSHLFEKDFKYNDDGDWSLGLKMSGAGQDQILAIIRESAGVRSQSERSTDFAKPPFIDNEDGSKTFKYKQSSIIRPKGKPESHTKIDVYDAKMNPWPRDINIGNGSKVKIRYKARSWNVQQQGGIGVTLSLYAVQVIDHVPYVPSHGFEEEEGIDMGMGSQASQGAPQVDKGLVGTMHVDIPIDDAPAPTDKPYETHTGGPVSDGVPF